MPNYDLCSYWPRRVSTWFMTANFLLIFIPTAKSGPTRENRSLIHIKCPLLVGPSQLSYALMGPYVEHTLKSFLSFHYKKLFYSPAWLWGFVKRKWWMTPCYIANSKHIDSHCSCLSDLYFHTCYHTFHSEPTWNIPLFPTPCLPRSLCQTQVMVVDSLAIEPLDK